MKRRTQNRKKSMKQNSRKMKKRGGTQKNQRRNKRNTTKKNRVRNNKKRGGSCSGWGCGKDAVTVKEKTPYSKYEQMIKKNEPLEEIVREMFNDRSNETQREKYNHIKNFLHYIHDKAILSSNQLDYYMEHFVEGDTYNPNKSTFSKTVQTHPWLMAPVPDSKGEALKSTIAVANNGKHKANANANAVQTATFLDP